MSGDHVYVYQDWDLVQAPPPINTPCVRSGGRASTHDQAVGVNIQRHRISRLWSVSFLSERTNIPREDLIAFERGELIPGPSVLALLKNVFMSDLK